MRSVIRIDGNNGGRFFSESPKTLSLEGSKASIILPFYNYSARMSEAFGSLARLPAEEAGRMELVVVNNGSSEEETGALVGYLQANTFPFPVKYVESGTNLPLGYARNLGASVSSGDFLGWLDPDDAVLPGRVSCALEILSATGGSGIVHANAWVRDIFGTHTLYDSGGPATYERLQKGCCVSCQSTLMPTWLYFALGGQRDLRAAEDYDLWLTAAAFGVRFIHIPAPVYIAVQHEQQKTRRDMKEREVWATCHDNARLVSEQIRKEKIPLLSLSGPLATMPYNDLPIGETSYLPNEKRSPVSVVFPHGVPALYPYSIGGLLLRAWRELRTQNKHKGSVSVDDANIEFRNSCNW